MAPGPPYSYAYGILLPVETEGLQKGRREAFHHQQDPNCQNYRMDNTRRLLLV